MKFPNQKFSVIYADPPWNFKTYSKKGMGRSAENHYSTMSLADIRNMPVFEIAEKDCVLFMWVTMPMLEEAMKVIKAWEFAYKTVAFSWIKTNKNNQKLFQGMGYWTRSNSEICLLATRGHPKRVSASVAQAIVSPRREHSRKPDEIYGRIEKLMGVVSRIELFARTKRPGWVSWGLQTDKF